MKRARTATVLAALAQAPLAALAAEVPAASADAAGAALFARHCVHCHAADAEATGTLQLARTRGKDKALLAGRQDLPREYVNLVVRNGLRAMPPFLPSQITDAEVRQLADWLRRQTK